MASFLIAYASSEGQTASIARRLEETITTRGHAVDVVDVQDTAEPVDLESADAVLIGASIHAGRHQKAIRSFVRGHVDTLASIPTAFFQVSLSSATEEGREEAAGYVEQFLEETGWEPDRIGQFGGALRFSQYGFLKRLMMKRVAAASLPDVEGSKDVEYTDWAEVEAFGADVAAFVEGRLGDRASSPEERSR
ncbi:MAG: flavodoxin domain-containing protein [Natrialbaceae archaeon]|nr:flavodoxin domain-containing protein [Natrialbaceae archaeon]